MPDTTNTTPLSVADIQAQATAERNTEVQKELVKKYKVVAKRRGQIAANSANFEAKVKVFEDAVSAATNAEGIMAAIESHKFPACSTGLVSAD